MLRPHNRARPDVSFDAMQSFSLSTDFTKTGRRLRTET